MDEDQYVGLETSEEKNLVHVDEIHKDVKTTKEYLLVYVKQTEDGKIITNVVINKPSLSMLISLKQTVNEIIKTFIG